MKISYTYFFLGIFVFAFLLQAATFFLNPKLDEAQKTIVPNNLGTKPSATIDGIKINLELAQTQSEIIQGLSGQASLEADSGMYFFLPSKGFYTFWMKEMKFPLDIIWITDGRIVGIEKNAPIPTGENIPTFNSPEEVTDVLEVNAGFSEQNNFKIGDKVELKY